VHPGGINTELGRHMSDAEMEALIARIDAAHAASGMPPFRWKTIPQGAATSVWAAAVAEANTIGGRYFEDCHVAEIADGDGIRSGVRPYALDGARAEALWDLSERLVGGDFGAEQSTAAAA
jgi:hypothetical protein